MLFSGSTLRVFITSISTALVDRPVFAYEKAEEGEEATTFRFIDLKCNFKTSQFAESHTILFQVDQFH